MSRTIHNRVERLEESLPPDKTPSQGKEDLRGWLRLLDNWPVEMTSPRMTDEEIAELRGACRGIADRVRGGELRTALDITEQLPADALLGLRAYFLRRGEGNKEHHPCDSL